MDIYQSFVHLARLSLSGQDDDVQLLIRRVLPKIRAERPDLMKELEGLLGGAKGRIARTRNAKEHTPLPIDIDSRLELLSVDEHPTLAVTPTWPETVSIRLHQFIEERQQENRLFERGMMPTRSLLFTGPPGVGKSLAASYLAKELNRPLLTLDLAAVMSSFLGRTGNNIRAVLDFARRIPSVLLLDEFDAIAKRRDDVAEVGELKRLVTVLLQAIDGWPSHGILLAATNHPDLLDPAVWRRFDRVVEFPYPSVGDISAAIKEILHDDAASVGPETVEILAALFEGRSFDDVRKSVLSARRDSLLRQIPLEWVLQQLISSLLQDREHSAKIDVAVTLLNLGIPERRINEITGIARDTFRKRKSTSQRGRLKKHGTET